MAVRVDCDRLATAVAGLCAAAIGAAVAAFGRGNAVAVCAGMVTLGVTPGCAVACWLTTGERLWRVNIVIAASLTWSIFVTTALALMQVISLGALLALTAGAGGAVSAAFLIARLARGRNGVRAPASDGQPRRREFGPDPPSRGPLIYGIAGLAVAAGLLALAVHGATGRPIGRYGLLPVFGVPFVAAAVLTIVVLVFSLRFVLSAWPAAIGALGLLAFELNGSQMMIVATPITAWSYKHFGVTGYVFHGGALNDPLDVYQQWPGFFALAAGLVRLSGRTPLTYGNWAGVFFVVLNAVTLFAIARRFSRGRRVVPYVAVLLFIVVNWEGQEYFSPQTAAFELSLLFQLFLLPFLEPGRVRPWLARLPWLGISPVAPLDIPWPDRAGRAGMTVRAIGLVALLAAITVTHQLSPYIVFAGVAALWVLGVLRRPLLLLAMLVVIGGYPLLHFAAVSQNSILTGLSVSNATGTKGLAQATPPQILAGDLAKLVTLGLWGGTAVSGLSYLRRLGVVVIPLILAFMPLSLVLVSSYGGEGIYRAFLFSSPWCAIVIATRVADMASAPVFRLVAVGSLALCAGLGSVQSGEFGQFAILEMPAEEVTASAYFLDHAPVNSTLVQAASNFPSRVNGRYVLHNSIQEPNDPGLDTLPLYEGAGLKNMSAKDLAISVTDLVRGSAYLVIAPSMYPLINYFGTFAPGTLPAVERRLMTSPYWKVWYDKGGTVIFLAVPRGTPAVKKPPARAGDHRGPG